LIAQFVEFVQHTIIFVSLSYRSLGLYIDGDVFTI
jgi:hypothetical protein